MSRISSQQKLNKQICTEQTANSIMSLTIYKHSHVKPINTGQNRDVDAFAYNTHEAMSYLGKVKDL